jgi:hypothetical protein
LTFEPGLTPGLFSFGEHVEPTFFVGRALTRRLFGFANLQELTSKVGPPYSLCLADMREVNYKADQTCPTPAATAATIVLRCFAACTIAA